MKTITIKDVHGRLVSVPVSDQLYTEIEQARRTDQTKKRIDRTHLVREELSDYHSHILLRPLRQMSDEIEEKVLIEQMLRCLGTLSDYERLLVHRYYYEGQSYASIAKDLGASYQAIQQRLNRVIARLSRMMGID